MSYSASNVTCVILAGGRGTRLHSSDKGLLALDKGPMIEKIITAVKPQAVRIIINANRNIERYREWGHPVISDALPGFQGPMAGMAAALAAAATPFLLTVPCDSPMIGEKLGATLHSALFEERAELAAARDSRRTHPVFCLMRTELKNSLDSFLSGGGRKIDLWFKTIKACYADCSGMEEMFANVNTPEEYAAVRQRLAE